MHESITCSTKILTLTIAPFLFLLVGAKCVHFIVPSGGRGTLFFLSAEMYTFSSMFIKKILTFVWHMTMPRLLMNWKKHKPGIQLCLVFIMRPRSTFQFVFGFNEVSVSNLFLRLLHLRKFLVLYLGCGCMAFDFSTQMTSSHFLPHANE